MAATAATRPGSSAAGGTRYGMRAWAIFCLARVRRLAIVASGTSSARATSGVVSPPRLRSASATWASTDRAGWQQVKISRSRSSRTTSSASGPRSGPGPWSAGGPLTAAASLPARRPSRRMMSMARRFAATTSQARGLSGTPSRGQVSSARTVASWVASSARSMLPVTRTRLASTRARSSLTSPATASPVGTTASTGRGRAGPRRRRTRWWGSWTRPRWPRPGRRTRGCGCR